MLNKFLGIGRITRDSELAYTPNQKAVSKFGIALNKLKKDEPTFLEVALWGKSAEAVNQYLKKGTQVYIEGELEIQKWEKEGVKHQRCVINCFNVQLLGSKSDSGMDRQDQKMQEQITNQIPF